MSSKFRRMLVASINTIESDCAFLQRFIRGPGDSEFPAPPESQTRVNGDAPATEQELPKASQRRRAKSAR